MSKLLLALFLVVFGLNLLSGLPVPIWVTGILAVAAGIMLLLEYFRLNEARK